MYAAKLGKLLEGGRGSRERREGRRGSRERREVGGKEGIEGGRIKGGWGGRDGWVRWEGEEGNYGPFHCTFSICNPLISRSVGQSMVRRCNFLCSSIGSLRASQ